EDKFSTGDTGFARLPRISPASALSQTALVTPRARRYLRWKSRIPGRSTSHSIAGAEAHGFRRAKTARPKPRRAGAPFRGRARARARGAAPHGAGAARGAAPARAGPGAGDPRLLRGAARNPAHGSHDVRPRARDRAPGAGADRAPVQAGSAVQDRQHAHD